MTTWILLIAILSGQPATAAAEFGSQEACETALRRVQAEWGIIPGIAARGVCVPSGFRR